MCLFLCVCVYELIWMSVCVCLVRVRSLGSGLVQGDARRAAYQHHAAGELGGDVHAPQRRRGPVPGADPWQGGRTHGHAHVTSHHVSESVLLTMCASKHHRLCNISYTIHNSVHTVLTLSLSWVPGYCLCVFGAWACACHEPECKRKCVFAMYRTLRRRWCFNVYIQC